MKIIEILGVVAVLAGGAMLGGCKAKVTGGGAIRGLEGERAAFTVNLDSCDDVDHPRGSFLYKDKNRGLSVKGELLEVRLPGDSICDFDGAPASKENTVGATATWRSTNPKNPGQGTATICMTDNGEGRKADEKDFVSIRLWRDGEAGGAPFHVNFGSFQGNIQQHECSEDL
jgi:hypothetical protein